MQLQHVTGDIVDQDVDVIVNAWNRNFIPYWLLIPQGVARSIKRRAGSEPFKELARHGPLPLGGAVVTSAGRLPHKGIIHVAAINMFWSATVTSVRDSVINALDCMRESKFESIAFPLLGGGVGGLSQVASAELIRTTVEGHAFEGRVVLVRYEKSR